MVEHARISRRASTGQETPRVTIAEDARAILQARVDQKVSAIGTFADLREQRERAAAALRDAETAEADAWSELKRLDWSDAELKTLGLSAPMSAAAKQQPRTRGHRVRRTAGGAEQQ